MAVKSSASRPVAREPRLPRSAKTPRSRPPRRNERFWHDTCGIVAITFAAVLLVSLILGPRSGLLGITIADASRALVGVGAYALPVVSGAIGILLITGRERESRSHHVGGALIALLLSISFWHLAHTTRETQFHNIGAHGGYLGASVVWLLRDLFNDVSSYLVLSSLTVITLVWTLDLRLLHIFGHAANAGKRIGAPMARSARAARESALELRTVRAEENERFRAEEDRKKAYVGVLRNEDEPVTKRRPGLFERHSAETKANASPTVPTSQVDECATVPSRTGGSIASTSGSGEEPPAIKTPTADDSTEKRTVGQSSDTMGQLVQLPLALAEDGTPYKFILPSFTLLKQSPPRPPGSEQASREKQAILMQTLNDFKIGANVAQVAVGPSVTRYEVQLEPGILVRKIVSLADNLAMALAAIDVRVEAPIPGKSAIGIEVPNDVVQLVSLRECIETPEFMSAASKLTFALGKDISGNYRYADIAKMPHLLVGGSTNSGKSVCLNVLISSILYRATPREVKFVMIDPKRVELSLYSGIPHLMAPVVTNVKQAAGILRSVIKEMEERYDRFAQMGTRNIDGFNNRVPPEERLPFIVVIIDELADLMMQQGPEVETSIGRLAQLARATGIHLVIATQRPSVDVITGTIKANIASRIAFAVATQVDSRTIIDHPGADRLIGRGDLLFKPIDASKPLRIQGCYIGERETEGLVQYLREQEEPVYTMIPSEISASGMDAGGEDDDMDDLFEPCVKWLVMQGQCSTSSLQRKFKIGYTRAARLVEMMEAKQIVGPQDGVKPREILLTADRVNDYFSGFQQGDLGQF